MDSNPGITAIPSSTNGYVLPPTAAFFAPVADKVYIVSRKLSSCRGCTPRTAPTAAARPNYALRRPRRRMPRDQSVRPELPDSATCTSDQVGFLDANRTILRYDMNAGDVISATHAVTGQVATVQLAGGANCAAARGVQPDLQLRRARWATGRPSKPTGKRGIDCRRTGDRNAMKRIGRSVVAGGVCLRPRRRRATRRVGFATSTSAVNRATFSPRTRRRFITTRRALPSARAFTSISTATSRSARDLVARRADARAVRSARAAGGQHGHGPLSTCSPGPTMAATAKFGNFAIGAGLFVPFGGRVNWGKNDNPTPDLPLTANGVQRFHMETAALTFLQVSGAAYKLGPVLIGADRQLDQLADRRDARALVTGQSTRRSRVTPSYPPRAGTEASGSGRCSRIRPTCGSAPRIKRSPGSDSRLLRAPSRSPRSLALLCAERHAGAEVHFHESLPDIWRGIRFRPLRRSSSAPSATTRAGAR